MIVRPSHLHVVLLVCDVLVFYSRQGLAGTSKQVKLDVRWKSEELLCYPIVGGDTRKYLLIFLLASEG